MLEQTNYELNNIIEPVLKLPDRKGLMPYRRPLSPPGRKNPKLAHNIITTDPAKDPAEQSTEVNLTDTTFHDRGYTLPDRSK